MGHVMKKTTTQIFSNVKTKEQISCAVTAQLISAFGYVTWIVQSLLFLNPTFQASSLLLWLYITVCVRLVGTIEDHFSHVTALIVPMNHW